jgi:hypothetical protein
MGRKQIQVEKPLGGDRPLADKPLKFTFLRLNRFLITVGMLVFGPNAGLELVGLLEQPRPSVQAFEQSVLAGLHRHVPARVPSLIWLGAALIARIAEDVGPGGAGPRYIITLAAVPTSVCTRPDERPYQGAPLMRCAGPPKRSFVRA